jgi:hypothetical protein
MFTNELLSAIGAWQRGWREDLNRRTELGAALEREAAGLDPQFRRVNAPCYRKRFIFKSDVIPLFLGGIREGVTSWTTDFRFAQDFHGLMREDAITAAIFSHRPLPEEVILHIPALWRDAEFKEAAERYRKAGGENVDALFNFADKQSEVVLTAPIRPEDIIGLTGKSSPFEDLCDQAGVVGKAERDRVWNELTKAGRFPENYEWVLQERALGVMSRALDRFEEFVDKYGAKRRGG